MNTKILNGAADMDTYSTTQFPGMGGKLFEELTLRLFDPKTRLWSLYWVASNTGKIDPPVVGSFDQNGVGHFFGKDTLNGKPILVVFRWDARNKDRPVWGQAFSPDKGAELVEVRSRRDAIGKRRARLLVVLFVTYSLLLFSDATLRSFLGPFRDVKEIPFPRLAVIW